MIPDLSTLSLEELNDVIAQAEALIEARKSEELKRVYAEVLDKASALGLTLEELLEQGARGARKTTPATTKKPVAVRFRNPENPEETWTGRGKQPRWLAAKLAAGATLESFAV